MFLLELLVRAVLLLVIAGFIIGAVALLMTKDNDRD